ncbi:Rhamnogalacturonan acetylesterase RhgT [Cytospora mali]|uniref:Rhamnogalacturonan acetylesterase RhgT n=1 Tax=Cytospora mali TaxID=578113 RepID=A0A194W3J3_CYTMA|nr:Rhamnogalacturonan acetylesterase RhgT [Valsa mali]
MSLITSLSALSLALLIKIASPTPFPTHDNESTCQTQPPAFFLAGDSTTAIQSSNGGGWGVGFLSTLQDPAWGIDYGHNGATTVSFVAGGDWANVIKSVQNSTKDYDVIVTIQFGHNDQKATANISLSEYQSNLENLATEVKEAGGTPILVTPLTRRNFVSEYVAEDNLADQRLATIAAANSTSTRYIDLNQASLQYIETIGNKSAQVYDLNGDDETHLNDYGSLVFGTMVADLILGHPPIIGDVDWKPEQNDCFVQWIKPNNTLSHEIWSGAPTT